VRLPLIGLNLVDGPAFSKFPTFPPPTLLLATSKQLLREAAGAQRTHSALMRAQLVTRRANGQQLRVPLASLLEDYTVTAMDILSYLALLPRKFANLASEISKLSTASAQMLRFAVLITLELSLRPSP
jgi:hypothetical protein